MKRIELFPADIYQIIDKSLLSEHDKLILNMLYMPLIGNIAVMLYLKLQSEVVNNTFISSELNHHHLMTSMGLTLDNIKEARLKLEGIGLMKAYYKEGSVNSYVYELYSPVSSNEFFSHPVFNIVLYNNVGKSEYNRLVNYFKTPHIQLKDYIDITTPIDKVFKSSSYTEVELETKDFISKNKLMLSYEMNFDFDLLSSMLEKNIFNEKSLNKSAKELITSLSFLYDIDPINMADLIKSSLNEKGNIEKDELRKNVRKFYQYNNEFRLPSLLFKKQNEYLKVASGDNSRKGRIIKVFENYSPYEFLKAKNKGVKPTPRDMSILEELLIDIKLNPAVVNVLIDYILKTNNNKLVKNYVETIAGQWKRSNIETASEAMEMAEKEHKKKYNKTTSKKEVSSPSWFDKEIKSTYSEDEEMKEFNSFIEEFRK